jgi:hypothetical protein
MGGFSNPFITLGMLGLAAAGTDRSDDGRGAPASPGRAGQDHGQGSVADGGRRRRAFAGPVGAGPFATGCGHRADRPDDLQAGLGRRPAVARHPVRWAGWVVGAVMSRSAASRPGPDPVRRPQRCSSPAAPARHHVRSASAPPARAPTTSRRVRAGSGRHHHAVHAGRARPPDRTIHGRQAPPSSRGHQEASPLPRRRRRRPFAAGRALHRDHRRVPPARPPLDDRDRRRARPALAAPRRPADLPGREAAAHRGVWEEFKPGDKPKRDRSPAATSRAVKKAREKAAEEAAAAESPPPPEDAADDAAEEEATE